MYTNPPDPNILSIDHGLDEDHIWAFRKTNYNQKVIFNQYSNDTWGAAWEVKAPWWGKKLGAPAFYKDEKYAKFWQQYVIRLNFEILKLNHANKLRTGDMLQRD